MKSTIFQVFVAPSRSPSVLPACASQISRAMAPTVRLTYFAGYGLAEQIRWMLAATETSFEQVPPNLPSGYVKIAIENGHRNSVFSL